MALSILDGNQSATTLSTIVTSGQHIPAHTIVSLGTQAITDMRTAVSGSVVSIPSIPAISGTVTANLGTAVVQIVNAIQDGDGTTFGIDRDFPISGTVTANVVGFNSAETFGTGVIQSITDAEKDTIRSSLWIPVFSDTNGSAGEGQILSQAYPMPILGTVTIGSALPASTNRIGVVTIGGGTVTIGAGTAQIGSVTVGNSVTIGSLPSISGTVTANLAISSSAITSGSFTSLTSATLVPANTARKMATVYNLGAGQLFINAGTTATTLGGGFMVALSSGDFYECDYTTTTLSAIFATAGTASWVSH
jgi:hypothetical protein